MVHTVLNILLVSSLGTQTENSLWKMNHEGVDGIDYKKAIVHYLYVSRLRTS